MSYFEQKQINIQTKTAETQTPLTVKPKCKNRPIPGTETELDENKKLVFEAAKGMRDNKFEAAKREIQTQTLLSAEDSNLPNKYLFNDEWKNNEEIWVSVRKL